MSLWPELGTNTVLWLQCVVVFVTLCVDIILVDIDTMYFLAAVVMRKAIVPAVDVNLLLLKIVFVVCFVLFTLVFALVFFLCFSPFLN